MFNVWGLSFARKSTILTCLSTCRLCADRARGQEQWTMSKGLSDIIPALTDPVGASINLLCTDALHLHWLEPHFHPSSQ